MSFAEIDRLLNKQSGMLGLTGQNDLREIEARQAAGDDRGAAGPGYVHLPHQEIHRRLYRRAGPRGCAGLHRRRRREQRLSCASTPPPGLDNLGFSLDEQKNRPGRSGPVTEIQTADSPIKILIIPTNEELEIAQQTKEVIDAL